MNDYKIIGETCRFIGFIFAAFIRLNKTAPYGHDSGQMNKLLKINLSNYCLSHLRVGHARLCAQSKGADAGRGVTTSCLGNYHHFWHELRGLLTASLWLLNSLLCWLMMKGEHAHTHLSRDCDIMCCASPVTLPAGQAKHNTHSWDCIDYHRGLAINTLFISIWRDTLWGEANAHPLSHTHPRTHTHIQIQPLYHISGRHGKSYIPVDALVFPALSSDSPALPGVSPPHSYSCRVRSLPKGSGRGWVVCKRTLEQGKHTKNPHINHFSVTSDLSCCVVRRLDHRKL